jgi:hypothetical protein
LQRPCPGETFGDYVVFRLRLCAEDDRASAFDQLVAEVRVLAATKPERDVESDSETTYLGGVQQEIPAGCRF